MNPNDRRRVKWFWRSKLPERKGQLCVVLARGKMNSILVEFEDGYRVITSRYAVRREVLKEYEEVHCPNPRCSHGEVWNGNELVECPICRGSSFIIKSDLSQLMEINDER